MEADRVIVELIAKVEGFDGKMAQSASAFEGGMKRIETAATRAEATVSRSADAQIAAIRRESAQISQAARIMGTQLNDIGHLLQGPNSPFVVPVKQAPAVGAALKYVQAGAAALGGVVGGLLTSAVISAGIALAEFIIKGNSTTRMINDMVDKLKEDAERTSAAREAKAIYSRTLEGVTEAIRANRDALRELNKEQQGAAERAAKDAALNLIIIEGIQTETQAHIDLARAILESQRARASGPGQASELAALDLPRRQAALDALEARLGEVNKQLGLARSNFNDLFKAAVTERAERLADPLKEISDRYRGLIAETTRLATTEEARNGTLDRQIRKLKEKQKAEEDAYRASQRRTKAESGLPKVTSAEVQALVKEVFGPGTQITSTRRSAAENRAAKGAANSLHLSNQAVDFIPQGGMKAFDREMLRLAAEARGIKVLELLGPGDKGHADHGHIAFARTRQGPDQVAAARERAARQAEAAADAESRRVQAYQNELANLQDQEIDARQALITSAEMLARLELDAIEISRKKYNANLAALVEQERLLPKEAEELQKLNDERARLRTELVQRRENERKFRLAEDAARRQLEAAGERREGQQELLQGQLQLAETQRQRRELETKLLELQYQEEQARNDYLIAFADRLRLQEGIKQSELDEAEAAAELARIRNETLAQRQANAQAGVNQSTQGPLDSFFGDIPGTAAEINEALESIAAGGLATFTDALTEAIMNWENFGQVGIAVLRQVAAGIIKLGIQQLLLHTIGKALGSTAIAATSAQAAAAGAAWAGPAALASLATLGANAGPAMAAIASTTALAMALGATPKGFATGGRIFGPGGPTADRVPIMASSDEFMIRAKAAQSVGYDTLDYINRTGTLPGFFAGGRIRRVSPMNAAAVPPRAAGATLSADAIAQLGGIVSRAIDAMPDVALYPTIDPADVLERALGSKRGSRSLIAHLGDNRGAVNGALQ